MALSQFIARYQATQTEMQTYVASLPLWVNVWRGWMFAVFTTAVFFLIWKREARWLVVTMVVSLLGYNLVSMFSGVGRFPSIAFVVFWTPLAIHLARRIRRLEGERTFDRIYRGWVGVALATLCVSLGFDVYNVAYSLVRGVP